MNEPLKTKVSFASATARLFQWEGSSENEDEAIERATAAWSGTWRMINGGDYGTPSLNTPIVEAANSHQMHVRWALSRTSCQNASKKAARTHSEIADPARAWARALLARDPATKAEDFAPHVVDRGTTSVSVNAPVATIGRSDENEVVVGMSYDHAASTQTIDAVMAIAMAVAWSKRAETSFNAIFTPANPLFSGNSATLRAGSIRDVMRRDAGKARMARNAVSSLGYREIAGAYPWI